MSDTKFLHYFDDFSNESSDIHESDSEMIPYEDVDVSISDELLDLVIVDLLSEMRATKNVDVVNCMLRNAGGLFSEEGTLLEIVSPVTVVGDIHGQFEDLVKVLEMGGFVFDREAMQFRLEGDAKFLFMGDYVDRGHFSVEVALLLICLKIRYPDSFFLLRGNHESRDVNMVYGFADHCVMHFKAFEVWENFNRVFDLLPIAAVIDGKSFAVHGGLSPHIRTLEELRVIDRFRYPFHYGLFEMLWSDPSDEIEKFFPSFRGAGYIWGEEATSTFLQENRLERIIRAHELQMSGFRWQHNNQVLTVFSAPNYCYRLGNSAAILKISANTHELNIETFSQTTCK